jgi:hypothetical protein
MSPTRRFLFPIVGSRLRPAIAALAICVAASGAEAQSSGQYFYPSKGQTQEQQARDKYECNQWAVGQSGFDPSNPPPTTSGNTQKGQAVRGAARGAAAGAIGGAIAGDAGTGAAAGAAIGGAAGGIRRRRAKKQQQAEAQTAATNGQDAYNRAFATCMQGRSYTTN